MLESLNWVDAVVALATAAAVTSLLVPPVEALAWRLGVVDQPGGRSIHDVPRTRCYQSATS